MVSLYLHIIDYVSVYRVVSCSSTSFISFLKTLLRSFPAMTSNPTLSTRTSFQDSVVAWAGDHLESLLEPLPLAAQHYYCSVHDANLNGLAFGGQLLGQALMVAQRNCADLVPSSLNVLFVEGATVDVPIEFEVTELQRGRRFARYQVRARQGGRIVLDAHGSFQADLAGFEHAVSMPLGIDPPESLLSMDMLPDEQGHDWAKHQKSCLELRLVDQLRGLDVPADDPKSVFWLKLRNPLPADPALHYAALAYLSDYWVNSGGITRHVALAEARERIFAASLNHSLWFHGECQADDWLLFVSDCPAMQRGRGLSMARVYQRDGRLVASIAQDCLVLERS